MGLGRADGGLGGIKKSNFWGWGTGFKNINEFNINTSEHK